MKKIHVFLASSAELENDKNQIEYLLNRKNAEWHDKGIGFKLFTWYNFMKTLTSERTLEEYKHFVCSSDICIFIVQNKIGHNTNEEFEHAHQAFLTCKDQIKRPRIITYFKTVNDEQDEILLFKKKIQDLGYFCDDFETMDEFIMKIDRQLNKIEKEGLIFKKKPINYMKISKRTIYYFILPLIILLLTYFTYKYFQPTDLMVSINEPEPIPGMQFTFGKLSLSYGDHTEQLGVKKSAVFKNIPAKYKFTKMQLRFTAFGYSTIDTVVNSGSLVELNIRRDNTFAIVFGTVKDEKKQPIKDVQIKLKDIQTKSDENGRFRIEIPISKQAEEQRITAYKEGYELFDYSGVPSPIFDWKIVLRK